MNPPGDGIRISKRKKPRFRLKKAKHTPPPGDLQNHPSPFSIPIILISVSTSPNPPHPLHTPNPTTTHQWNFFHFSHTENIAFAFAFAGFSVTPRHATSHIPPARARKRGGKAAVAEEGADSGYLMENEGRKDRSAGAGD